MKRDVTFESEGKRIAGCLYRPDGDAQAPGIVLCHGFAGVKELLLPAFAERFAERGYTTLTFDYRGFGESEGEPGRLVPELQVQDIRNAVTFLADQTMVDASRIGLWGTSFGGANAIVVAANDKRVRCLVVQLTFGDGERVITGPLSEKERVGLLALLEKMKRRKAESGKEMMVPIKKVLTDPQSQAFYEEKVGQFEALNIKIPMLTLAETMGHKPEQTLSQVQVPIHITCAEQDAVNPPEESRILYERAVGPKELLTIEGATHYAVYSGAFFEQAVEGQLAWFDRYL